MCLELLLYWIWTIVNNLFYYMHAKAIISNPDYHIIL